MTLISPGRICSQQGLCSSQFSRARIFRNSKRCIFLLVAYFAGGATFGHTVNSLLGLIKLVFIPSLNILQS